MSYDLMYLKEIQIRNIKTFKDLKLDFTTPSGPKLLNGFLGPNGMGKSIFLNCIALSLLGESALRIAIPQARNWVRIGEDYGLIETKIDISHESNTLGKDELLLRHFVIGKKGSEIDGRYMQGPAVYADYKNEDNQIFDKITGYESEGFLICGYGPFRRPPREEEKKFEFSKEENPRASRVSTLFNESSPMRGIQSWLLNQEFRRLKGDYESQEILRKAFGIIPKILPNVSIRDIDKEGDIIFETKQGAVSLSELSDGYRSLISWTADLFRHVFDAHPRLPDPTQGTGIVVIDEIDVHLHPGAQRKIIKHLRETFPRIQFIFSSHSPFVAQSLETNEIYRLYSNEENNQTEIKPLESSLKGWRVDQVLTSDAFGLESSRDEETEQDFKEYEELIQNIELDRASNSDKNKAQILEKKLFSKVPFSGETPRIRKLEEQISSLNKIIKKYEKNDQS